MVSQTVFSFISNLKYGRNTCKIFTFGQGIFECLSNENFAKCRNIGRNWRIFIDSEMFSSLRIIKKKPKKSFEIALKNSTKEDAKSIANIILKFCHIWVASGSELHIAASNGLPQIFEEIFDNSEIEQTNSEISNMKPLELAAGKGFSRISKLVSRQAPKQKAKNLVKMTPLHICNCK